MVKALKDRFYQVTVEPSAIVCAMVSNIAMPKFLFKAAGALYNSSINVENFAQSLMQVNM